MKVTTYCLMLCAAGLAIAFPSNVQAAPVQLFTFTTAYSIDNNTSFNIGNEFKTGLTQELYVSAIGAFVPPTQISGGLSTRAYTATLYADDNTTVLASATIPVGTSVNAQGFAYTPLTYVLQANTNYVLTEYAGPSLSVYTYGSPGVPSGTWNAGTTFVQNWFNSSGGAPNTSNGSYYEFMGGNMIVDTEAPVPAPEPTSALLLSCGILAMVKSTRRCQRRQA